MDSYRYIDRRLIGSWMVYNEFVIKMLWLSIQKIVIVYSSIFAWLYFFKVKLTTDVLFIRAHVSTKQGDEAKYLFSPAIWMSYCLLGCRGQRSKRTKLLTSFRHCNMAWQSMSSSTGGGGGWWLNAKPIRTVRKFLRIRSFLEITTNRCVYFYQCLWPSWVLKTF